MKFYYFYMKSMQNDIFLLIIWLIFSLIVEHLITFSIVESLFLLALTIVVTTPRDLFIKSNQYITSRYYNNYL